MKRFLRVCLMIALGGAAGCNRSKATVEVTSAGDAGAMIQIVRVTTQDSGVKFAEFRFTNTTGGTLEYYGDRRNAPRTQVERPSGEGWVSCGPGLCGNSGRKPGYFTLGPGESVTFSIRWDVFEKHARKRIGIQAYRNPPDRNRSEWIWSGVLAE